MTSSPWKSRLGAARLFQYARGSTAHYKRALLLAVERGMSFGQYADGLSSQGTLDYLETAEAAARMVEYEVGQLKALAGAHGFTYGAFLRVYYPLVAKAAYFTAAELISWFGETFRTKGDERPLTTVYGNGLTYLVRLNFLLVVKRPEGVAFGMPPNQRLSMQALSDPAVGLPAGVPLRGAKERLSLALERAKTLGLEALSDFLAMENDYTKHVADPAAAAAVFYSMMVRAEIAGAVAESAGLVERRAALAILDEIVGLYDLHKHAFPSNEIDANTAVAMALVNKGVRLGALGRPEDEIAVYDEVVQRFGDRSEPALAERVAMALVNKGVRLGALGRPEEARATFDEVLTRYADAKEPALAKVVERAQEHRQRPA